MSGMDTNSIQPTNDKEIATVSDSVHLQLFRENFLRLTELGVWPLALTASTVVLAICPGIPAFLMFGFWAGLVSIMTGIFSAIVCSITWWGLSYFKWPKVPKLVTCLWTSIFVSLVALNPLHPWSGFGGAAFSAVGMIMVILPSIIGGFTAIFSYYYQERQIAQKQVSKKLLQNDNSAD